MTLALTTDRKATVATILGLALSVLSKRELDMKTYIKIAAGLAVLGLLAAACSRDADRRAREASGAEGEPVGEVGTLTDVPTGPAASSSSETVNGAVATEAPGYPALQGSGTTTPSRSTSNPSPPAATSSPPSAPD